VKSCRVDLIAVKTILNVIIDRRLARLTACNSGDERRKQEGGQDARNGGRLGELRSKRHTPREFLGSNPEPPGNEVEMR
jgi:hypothetical protein